jgi:hypothetical protein
MTSDKKLQMITKVAHYCCPVMIGMSAVSFAAHICRREWSPAAAWFCAGMAWIMIEMKDRTIGKVFEMSEQLASIAAYQHNLLVKHGVIHEEAPEKEAVEEK